MHFLTRVPGLFLAPLVLVAAPLAAQRAEIISTPGRIIEVTGLERWTIRMLQDSLAKYAPGDSLHSHDCAATLRYRLGFPEASATTRFLHRYPTDATQYTLIHVVEPQDSARVHHLPRAMDTVSNIPEWAEMAALVRASHVGARVAWMIHLAEVRAGANWVFPSSFSADSAPIAGMQRWLEAHRTTADRLKALQVLRESRSMVDQSVAASILGTFPNDDASWGALIRLLRTEEGWALGFAGGALNGMAYAGGRPSSWAPLAEDIHMLLDGTGLYELDDLALVLVRAGVDSTEARPFLRRGGRALLERASTSQTDGNREARALLRALHGEPFGTDRAEWRAWLASLDTDP